MIDTTHEFLFDQLSRARPGHIREDVVAAIERPLYEHVLATHGGNEVRASRALGINRNTLRTKIRLYGIRKNVPAFVPESGTMEVKS